MKTMNLIACRRDLAPLFLACLCILPDAQAMQEDQEHHSPLERAVEYHVENFLHRDDATGETRTFAVEQLLEIDHRDALSAINEGLLSRNDALVKPVLMAMLAADPHLDRHFATLFQAFKAAPNNPETLGLFASVLGRDMERSLPALQDLAWDKALSNRMRIRGIVVLATLPDGLGGQTLLDLASPEGQENPAIRERALAGLIQLAPDGISREYHSLARWWREERISTEEECRALALRARLRAEELEATQVALTDRFL